MSGKSGSIPTVVLDGTVLSNFASTDATDWLVRSFADPKTVPEVREELQQGVDDGYTFLNAALAHLSAAPDEPGGIDVVVVEDLEDHEPDLGEELDPGEAYALGAAMDLDGALATDDLDARTLAGEHGVPVVGSIGILGRGIRRDELAVETADDWLATWVEDYGYFSPVESINELLSE